MFEVIDAVKQVSGVDFDVRISSPRAGDPAALVAGADRIKAKLGWRPQHDNLAEIVRQALDWERRLHNRTIDLLSDSKDLYRATAPSVKPP